MLVWVLNQPLLFDDSLNVLFLKVFCIEDSSNLLHPLFFINNPFLTLAPKLVKALLKNRPKKLFSNCLVDGQLTSIV